MIKFFFVSGNELRRRHTAAPAAAPVTPSAAAAPAPARSQQLQQPKAMNLSMSFAGDVANTSVASQVGDADRRNASPVPGQRPAMPGGHLQRSESSFDAVVCFPLCLLPFVSLSGKQLCLLQAQGLEKFASESGYKRFFFFIKATTGRISLEIRNLRIESLGVRIPFPELDSRRWIPVIFP